MTFALTPRHRWCIDKITECFAFCEGVDDVKVQSFIRKPDVLLKFKALFSGEKGSRNALFVHFQVREEINDENAIDRNGINRVSNLDFDQHLCHYLSFAYYVFGIALNG